MDFNLQMRFWRGVTDAMIHSTDAAMAAAAAWQDEFLNTAERRPERSAQGTDTALNPWFWWLSASPWMAPAPAPVQTPFGFWPTMPSVTDYWRLFAVQPASPSAFSGQNPFWPWPTAWAAMQMPLTAMIMSAGVPFAVASPSAKASAAVMDAADAARQQIANVYSAYRSDGGHAATQITTLPFAMAATFMAGEPAKLSGFGW